MPKSNVSSEWKKLLIIPVVLLFVMTPMGKHALVDASNFIGKKITVLITRAIPKAPAATPTSSTSSSK